MAGLYNLLIHQYLIIVNNMKNIIEKEFILSPSSLNLYLKEPALWVLKHFYGIRGGSNIYTVRGKLVEHYVNLMLKKTGSKTLTQTAILQDICFNNYEFLVFEEFKSKTKTINFRNIRKPYLIVDNVEVTREDLKHFWNWGKHAYKCLPIPEKVEEQQTFVSGRLNEVKIGGYLDYKYHDVVIDLKTTNKLPIIVSRGEREGLISKTKIDNVRQQVIYNLCLKSIYVLLYVTPTEHLGYIITQEDIDEVMPSIFKGIKEIKNLLTMKKEDVILNVELGKMNNPFMWNEQLKLKARELWNTKTKT